MRRAHASSLQLGATPKFYFFDQSHKESLSTKAFLRALLQQILLPKDLVSDLQRRIEAIFGVDGKKNPDETRLETLVLDTLHARKCTVLIVDGIEGLPKTERENVIRILRLAMEQSEHVKVFVTSTPEVDLTRISKRILRMGPRVDILKADIARIVKSRFEMEDMQDIICRYDQALIENVKSILVEESGGM